MSNNLKPRTTSTKQPSISADHDTPNAPLQRQKSFSQRAISQTITGTANLAKHLPTGTLLAFQLLIPIFTQNGACDAATRPLTFILLLLLALSCFLACFTDTVEASSDGQIYHGFATFKGLWLFDNPDLSIAGLPDLRKYRIRFIDVVHAVLSVLVFGAVALRDKHVLGCFYPTPGHKTQEVLDIVPLGVGVVCSLLFMVFPTRRHGIGHHVTPGKEEK